ncbi:MAG: hypothetical protein ACK5UE_04475 [Chitinophagales bacterium]|jgi:hypothetical protein|nr:hypothetical protein [Sphingobacteriales bacterium]
MFVSRWLGNGGNLTIEGEFRVRDVNGNNQFLIDNTGFVRAREIKVDMQLIPDYVFKSGYKLMSLGELEKYIITIVVRDKFDVYMPEIDNRYWIFISAENGKMLSKITQKCNGTAETIYSGTQSIVTSQLPNTSPPYTLINKCII